MPRNVYFAFHYQADIWRVNHVRHHHLTLGGYKIAGYFDFSLWEESQKRGEAAIKRMIDDALQGTSVTAVLIGAETWLRTYVNYEIQRSLNRGNGLLGVYIHTCKDQNGFTSVCGTNPLSNFNVTIRHQQSPISIPTTYTQRASDYYKTYDWMWNDGYRNFETWLDEAARLAGKN